MPQKEELLDFEDPILPSPYEKVLDYLEGISTLVKLLEILMASILAASIVFYKASPDDVKLLEVIIVTGGFFIILITSGFFLQIIIAIGSGIVEVTTNRLPKISKLGMLSITLCLSILLLLTLTFLAIFIN